jgi:hypothetical protein
MRGLGGVAVFVNGAIGGLMSTVPGFPIRDPFDDVVHRDPSFAKARAQGQRLARLGLEALRGDDVTEVREASIALQARTLELPLDNRLLLLGAALGVVPRGSVQPGVIRTEVAAFRVGPASFLTVPGEIYPEIVNGGISQGAPTALWWVQLATAVVFGLGTATVLTLVVTPAALAARVWLTRGLGSGSLTLWFGLGGLLRGSRSRSTFMRDRQLRHQIDRSGLPEIIWTDAEPEPPARIVRAAE